MCISPPKLSITLSSSNNLITIQPFAQIKALALQDSPDATASCHLTSISLFLFSPNCDMICLGYFLPLSFVVCFRFFLDRYMYLYKHTRIYVIHTFSLWVCMDVFLVLCWYFLFSTSASTFPYLCFLALHFHNPPILSQFSQTYFSFTATGKKSKKAREKETAHCESRKGDCRRGVLLW